MTIKEITLLSKEEYEKYESVIPKIDCCWWLRSPGDFQDHAAFVCSNGNVVEYGDNVDFGLDAVRPTLKLSLDTSDSLFWYKPEKLISTKIECGNYKWTILDVSLGELYVLCDEFITERRFDIESNDWDKSELKRWLETEGLKLITK